MGAQARRRQRTAAPQVLPAHRRGHPRRTPRTRRGLHRRPAHDGGHDAARTRERALTRRPPAQRIAEHLTRRACRYLPGETRDERCREWAAELPAILHDPGIRFAPLRSARALIYAADTFRSTRYPLGALKSKPDGAAAASAGVRLFISVGIWIGLVSLIGAFPPHGPWILLVVAASVVNGVFAAVQEVRLFLWLFRHDGWPPRR